MKALLGLYVLALIVGQCSIACAENFKLSNSSLSHRIPQPFISTLFEDSHGVLWIGTDEGLYRFDGAILSRYHSGESGVNWIPSGEIRDISEDSHGSLLVATAGAGLLTKNDQSSSFFPYKSSHHLFSGEIKRMKVSQDGSIWITTNDQVVLASKNQNDVSEWLATDSVRKQVGRPSAILAGKFGELFVGSNHGIVKISPLEKTIYRYDLTKLHNQADFVVSAIEFDSLGNLIIGTDAGLVAIIDPEKDDLLATLSVSKAKVFIKDVKTFKNKILIATDKGLYISESTLSQLKRVDHERSDLFSNDIHTMLVDDDRVWIGTNNGLDLLSAAPFELLNNLNSRVDNDIQSFQQDMLGRIWIGTYNGLYKLEENSGTHVRFDSRSSFPKLTDERVTALSVSRKRLWVGFFRQGYQSFVLNSDNEFVPSISNSSNLFVTDINAEDEENLGVWISTYNHGLLRVTSDKVYFYFNKLSDIDNGVMRVFTLNGRTLIVSTKNNIYEYNGSDDTFRALNFQIKSRTDVIGIFSAAEDGTGNIWFGTKEHGLLLWRKLDQTSDNYSLEHVNNGNDLQHSTIYGIEVDKSGNLWCSTQNGIVKLDPQGKLIRRFTTADGLQGRDFSFGASFQSREGIIYFGGSNGYNRFDPNAIAMNTQPSRMRLTNISFPGRSSEDVGDLEKLQSVKLSHRDRSVSFQFSVLDFVDPERNQFRYKLDNFDTDWIENGTNNTATFTNLPAGDYTLRVQGANSAGVWNREGLSLAITVLPAPWLTWWAFSLYGVVLLCAAWAINRIFYSYVVERRSAALATEIFEAENRADDDMQEQLEMQDEWINAAHLHSQTTLALISEGISIRNPDTSGDTIEDLAAESIKRIAALQRLEDCLSYDAGGPLADLHKYTERLFPVLLEESSLAPETVITINEVTTAPIPVALASPLAIVIYELLENCFQHAFEPGSPANYVHVTLSHVYREAAPFRRLQLTVQDSGVGTRIDINQMDSECYGLAHVESIVKKLGGTLEISGTSGTLVIIEVPEPEYS